MTDTDALRHRIQIHEGIVARAKADLARAEAALGELERELGKLEIQEEREGEAELAAWRADAHAEGIAEEQVRLARLAGRSPLVDGVQLEGGSEPRLVGSSINAALGRLAEMGMERKAARITENGTR